MSLIFFLTWQMHHLRNADHARYAGLLQAYASTNANNPPLTLPPSPRTLLDITPCFCYNLSCMVRREERAQAAQPEEEI